MTFILSIDEQLNHIAKTTLQSEYTDLTCLLVVITMTP